MLLINDLMSTDVMTLRDTDSLHRARALMTEQRIRHLPIVDHEEKLVGLLALRDVIAASVSALADIDEYEQESLDSKTPIAAVMVRELAVVEAGTDLREAGQYMIDNKIGCLPVVADGRLQGIVTEADFVQLAVHLLTRA